MYSEPLNNKKMFAQTVYDQRLYTFFDMSQTGAISP